MCRRARALSPTAIRPPSSRNASTRPRRCFRAADRGASLRQPGRTRAVMSTLGPIQFDASYPDFKSYGSLQLILFAGLAGHSRRVRNFAGPSNLARIRYRERVMGRDDFEELLNIARTIEMTPTSCGSNARASCTETPTSRMSGSRARWLRKQTRSSIQKSKAPCRAIGIALRMSRQF